MTHPLSLSDFKRGRAEAFRAEYEKYDIDLTMGKGWCVITLGDDGNRDVIVFSGHADECEEWTIMRALEAADRWAYEHFEDCMALFQAYDEERCPPSAAISIVLNILAAPAPCAGETGGA